MGPWTVQVKCTIHTEQGHSYSDDIQLCKTGEKSPNKIKINAI